MVKSPNSWSTNRSHQPTGRLPSCDSAVVGPEGSHPTSAAADRKSWPSFSQPSTHQSLLESRDTGFFKKKQPSTKKFQHPPEAPRPPVSMLLTIASQWPEQESVFFWRLRQALLSHNIEIGGPGVSNSPRQTSSWSAVFFWRTRYHEITPTKSLEPVASRSRNSHWGLGSRTRCQPLQVIGEKIDTKSLCKMAKGGPVK